MQSEAVVYYLLLCAKTNLISNICEGKTPESKRAEKRQNYQNQP